VKQLLLEVETREGERKDDMVPEELREGKLKVLKQMHGKGKGLHYLH